MHVDIDGFNGSTEQIWKNHKKLKILYPDCDDNVQHAVLFIIKEIETSMEHAIYFTFLTCYYFEDTRAKEKNIEPNSFLKTSLVLYQKCGKICENKKSLWCQKECKPVCKKRIFL